MSSLDPWVKGIHIISGFCSLVGKLSWSVTIVKDFNVPIYSLRLWKGREYAEIQCCKVLLRRVTEHLEVVFVGPGLVQLWHQLRLNLTPKSELNIGLVKSLQSRKNSMLTSHASCPHWQLFPSPPAHSPSQAQSQSQGQLWWRSKARLHHFLQAGNIFCIGKWLNMEEDYTKFVSISSHLKLMRQNGQSLCWGLQWSNVAGYLAPL